MNPEALLIFIFGMVCGGCLATVTTWRMARKIEFHGVKLAEWDRPFDMKAPRADVVSFERQSTR